MFNDFLGDGGYWHEPDPFLVDLISTFVNRGGTELGITLFIRGLVITGTLVSEQDYLNAMSDMFAAQAKRTMVNPTVAELKATEDVFDFMHLAEDVEPILPQNGTAEDDDDSDLEDIALPVIRHLHLKDPTILQPGPPISFSHSQISIIRIRLTAVDGWMIGKVTVDEEDDGDYMPPPPNQIRH